MTFPPPGMERLVNYDQKQGQERSPIQVYVVEQVDGGKGGHSYNQQLKRGLQQPGESVNWAECQSLDYYHQ